MAAIFHSEHFKGCWKWRNENVRIGPDVAEGSRRAKSWGFISKRAQQQMLPRARTAGFA